MVFLLLVGVGIGLFLREFYKKYKEGNETLTDIALREGNSVLNNINKKD